MVERRIARFGPPALDALRAAVVAAQGGDPLARVTVAAPSDQAASSVRGWLATSGGIANCLVLTLDAVAERLGTPFLAAAGRKPLTAGVLQEAIRETVADAGGPLAAAIVHDGPRRHLERTLAELRADPHATAWPDALRVYRAVWARLGDWYDAHDLARAAAATVDRGCAYFRRYTAGSMHNPDEVGHLVLYVPRTLPAAARALCDALDRRGRLTEVRGTTEGLDVPTDLVISVPDPEEEVRAAIRVVLARARDHGLALHRAAILYPDPSPYAVIAEEELAAAGIPPFPSGVLTGELGAARGTDLDLVVVVGMAEDVAPGDEEDRGEDYLAALAAARRERVLVFGRADPRSGRARHPSRWLDATGQARHERVPSFAGGLAVAPVSVRDRDLAELLGWPGDIAGHPLIAADPVLARGVAAHRARASGAFTVWDGNVGPHARLALRGGRPVTGPALETYAACGMRYLLGRVLWVDVPPDGPGDLALTARERDAVVRRMLSGAALDELDEELDGRVWAVEREDLIRFLARYPDEEERLRAELGTIAGDAGLVFGDDDLPVLATLPDGTRVPVRGAIDRLDWAPDRSRAVAIDVKTGRNPKRHRDALAADPVARGQLLDLPLGALAARARLGDVPVTGLYWFVSQTGDYERVPLELDDQAMARFAEAAGVLVDGIEAGRFPARQGWMATSSRETCDLCPYDLICAADRVRAWERKRTAPELAAYAGLVDGDE